jgi:hypothetical protein
MTSENNIGKRLLENDVGKQHRKMRSENNNGNDYWRRTLENNIGK